MVASKEVPPISSFVSFFYNNQFRTVIPLLTCEDVDLNGKLAIISGSNSGLGLECAKQMLSLGLSHLILAVRSQEKGDAAAAELRKLNPDATVEVSLLDMESYKSIQDFVQRCEKLNKIDYFIANSGIHTVSFVKSKESGHEEAMQVNFYGTMLLVYLLVPVLKAKKVSGDTPARITVVTAILSSNAQFPTKEQRPVLPTLDDEKNWLAQDRYPVSKLLGQLLLVKLSEQVSAEDVTINMVEPGFVKSTNLANDMPGIARMGFSAFAALTGRSPDRGAATFIDAAAVQGKESHGSILINCKIGPLPAIAYTPECESLTEAIFNETMDEFKFAGVRELLEGIEK